MLNVYNWTDYIDPAAVQRFERESGIRVRYDVYDSLETLEGKLSAGRSGYDVIVPSSEPTFARLVRAGALRPLDRDRIPNWRNLDPALMERVAARADPGNRHGAIYLWGTVGVGFRPDRVRALAPDAPTDTLDLRAAAGERARLARCGLAVMDSATDVLPSVLRWLGRDPNSGDAADLRAAEAALLAIRPHLRAIPGSGALVDMLATGEICAALTYSGDAIQASVRAREAGRGVEIAYAAPRGRRASLVRHAGGPGRRAQSRCGARLHRFPAAARGDGRRSATRCATRTPCPPPGRCWRRRCATTRSIYPPAEALANAFLPSTPPPAAERARSRLWSRFKAGR